MDVDPFDVAIIDTGEALLCKDILIGTSADCGCSNDPNNPPLTLLGLEIPKPGARLPNAC